VDTPGTLRIAVPVETLTYEVTGLNPAGERFTAAEADQPGTARLIDHARTRYWNDALTAPLPSGQVGQRALVHKTYKIALTSQELALFDGRVTDPMLIEGGYVFEDGAWWIPFAVQHYDPSAFYLPSKLESPFGNTSSVEYDAYILLPALARASATAPLDALVTQVINDYRLLCPVRIVDPNGNGTRAAFDILGLVNAT
jgi:hypothetical protein